MWQAGDSSNFDLSFTFSHRAFHVPHNETILIVQKFDSNLGDLRQKPHRQRPQKKMSGGLRVHAQERDRLTLSADCLYVLRMAIL